MDTADLDYYRDLDRLPETLRLTEMRPFLLDNISHFLLSETLRDRDRAEGALHAALAAHEGPVTPIVDRVAIQYMDSLWRNAARPDRRGTLVREGMAFLEGRIGRRPAVMLYEGALALRNDHDRETAFARYREAAEAAGEALLPRMYVGAQSVRTPDTSDWAGGTTARIIGSAATVDWLRLPEARSGICVMMAGDANYFITFARHVYDEMRRRDRACNIHFHVVNWSPDCAAVFDGVADPRLSLSVEDYRYRRDYSYFALARFYRAAEIMERLDMPLYITDLDNKMLHSPTAKAPALAALDGGFGDQGNMHWFPWWGPTAWNTYITDRPAGRQLAAWMRDYCAARFLPNFVSKSWWFDQLMLNEVQHLARAEGMVLDSTRKEEFFLTRNRPYEETREMKAKR